MHNANSVIVFFYMERAVKAYVYQVCDKYAETKFFLSWYINKQKKDYILFHSKS